MSQLPKVYLLISVFIASFAISTTTLATPTLGLYLFVVKSALPTTEEAELREEKCSYDGWAHIGMMKCSCTLKIEVGCQKDGRLNAQTLSGAATARQRLYTSVCKKANDLAKRSLEKSAYEYEKTCVRSGGVAVRSGEIEYLK